MKRMIFVDVWKNLYSGIFVSFVLFAKVDRILHHSWDLLYVGECGSIITAWTLTFAWTSQDPCNNHIIRMQHNGFTHLPTLLQLFAFFSSPLKK